MLDDVERLDTLINHLLDAARLDHRLIDVETEDVDLSQILAACVDGRLPAVSRPRRRGATGNGTAVRPRPRGRPRPGVSQSDRQCGEVRERQAAGGGVGPAPGEGYGMVRISDNGKGIPSDLRRKIFGRFFRVGEELERETPGLGLGLYIVRTMVRRLQGKIRVRDREGGPGTTFEVTLPGAVAQRWRSSRASAPRRVPRGASHMTTKTNHIVHRRRRGASGDRHQVQSRGRRLSRHQLSRTARRP